MKNRSDWVVYAAVGFIFLTAAVMADNCTTDFQQSNGPIITPCQSEIILQKGQNFTIKCKGKSRLEFKQQEQPLEVNIPALIEQRITNESSDPDYPFETVLDLYNIDEYTIGYYACFDSTVNKFEVLTDLIKEPNNTDHISYIYIYVNGTDSLLAPMRELVIPKGNVFVIECRPTTPDVEVTLNMQKTDKTPDYVMVNKKIGYIFTKCRFAYQCIGRLGNRNETKRIRNVKVPSAPTIQSNYMQFLENETFVLNCTVEYDKLVPVNLKWVYPQAVPNETIIQFSNEFENILSGQYLYLSLTVINARKEHEGKYTCIAKNSCGSKNASVIKEYLDKAFIELTLSKRQIKNGIIPSYQNHIQIPIVQKAYPPVQSSYFLKDGKNFTIDGERITVKRRIETDDVLFSINRATLCDSGDYTYVSSNNRVTMNITLKYRKLEKPNITFENDKKALINTIVTFECKVTGYPEPTISWIFSNGKDEQILDTTELINNPCYEQTARLKIPVKSGNVTCKAKVDEEEYFSTRRLFVYEVADGFGLEEGQNLWFWQNQDIEVKCFASIYDYESVTWLNQKGNPLNTMVSHTNSSYSHIAILKVNQVTLDLAGIYICKAIANNKSQNSKPVHITVEAFRSPKVKLPEKTVSEEVYPTQQNIILNCLADGVPPPQIRWEKDGEVLQNNSDIEIITRMIGKTTVNSTFKVVKMKTELKGKYECVAFSKTEQRRSYMLLLKDESAYVNYLIVIIIIIFFLIILVVYLTWKIKKMKRFKRELAAAGLLYFEEGATKSLNPDLAIDEQADLLPYDKKFEFPQEKLKLGKQLGAGAFGVVYKAEARGIINAEEVTTVAVKMVKKNAETMFIKALASELKIMVHLGKHVNIVNLLGACTKNVGKRELIVIVEYCMYGNIHNYMQKHREVFIDQLSDNKEKNHGKVNRGFSYSSGGSTGSHSDYFGSMNTQETDHTFLNTANTNRSARKVSEGYVQPEWRSNYESDYSFDGRSPRPLTSRDLLAWAFQIARGMEYLASRKILHGDLAARNVLLAEDNVVKICDFGLAKSIYKNDEYQKKENSPLPIKWLALESMTDRIFSTQSDVWSFGVVLWELFSLAKTPYPNINPTCLVQWLSDGHRLEKPPYADERLYGVMKKCWEQKPTERPSFTELQETLGTFLEDNVRNHYVDLNSVYMAKNVKAEGEQDYLEMVCAPDYNNLVTPSPHHYINTRSFFPTTPTQIDEDGYLQMNPSPQRVFSPRPTAATFDFEARKLAPRASEASSGSELTPMLALNRLPTRSGSESDQEYPESHSPYANGCPRIDEESDDVFEKRNNEKNVQPAAVTNPTYITFDLDLEKKPKNIINNYANVNIPVPNGIVE